MTDRERRRALPGVPSVPTQSDALSHALAMVVGPLLMGLFGAWLDGLLGTGWIFAALFATLGAAGAIISAYYRYEARMAEHDEGKPWTRRSRSGEAS